MKDKIRKLPLISVCIPAYNHEKYVAECIESVINQDYENIELIIINDGSKDKTHDVIMQYQQKCQERFVRFEYRNRENKGLSITLNEIVAWSKGKYFTGVASDDVMLKNKVSLLVYKLESLDDSYAVAFGNAVFIDDNSQELYLDRKTKLPTSKENGFNLFLDYYTYNRNFDYRDENTFGSYKTLLAGNYLPAMSYVVKLDKIREVGAWTNDNTVEDWEMWLKLSKKYKFVYIDTPVALYRWHESNSCKIIRKNLLYDSVTLIEKEKNYALSNGYKNIYYESLVNGVASIIYYNFKDFPLKYFAYIFEIEFIKSFVKTIIKNIMKLK